MLVQEWTKVPCKNAKLIQAKPAVQLEAGGPAAAKIANEIPRMPKAEEESISRCVELTAVWVCATNW